VTKSLEREENSTAGSKLKLVSFRSKASTVDTHHTLDWLVKLSTIDALLLNETNLSLEPAVLFSSLSNDLVTSFQSTLMFLPFLYCSDFQDVVVTLLHYSPELTLALRDMLLFFWAFASMSALPSAVFDVFQDHTTTSLLEFMEYLTLFYAFIVVALFIVSSLRLLVLGYVSETYVVRAYAYLTSISTEVRFSLEAGIQSFFFVFLYTSMMLMTFDDDQEELLEFFNSMCFYFFLFTLVYYLFKYSFHYFSYLESPKGDSRTYSPSNTKYAWFTCYFISNQRNN
jgi:hypothetical protein